MLKKVGLWRGLGFVFVIMLVLSITVAMVLEAFSSTIDVALGTRSQIIVSDDDGTTYNTFKPFADVLNADGTGNSKALIQKAIDLGRRQGAEGSVLLKNDNAALPLKGNKKVTLLGIRSHATIMGSNFGVKVQGPVITLEDALSKTKTDFGNSKNWATGKPATGTWETMDNFDFEGAGYQVNPVMSAVYEDINKTVGLSMNDAPTNSLGKTPTPYDPKEPSLADLAESNAGYKDSFNDYGDAAIVVISRPGAEATDYLPGDVAETGAEEPLQLTTNEKDTIKLATDNFDKVVVLVNSTSAMEIDELKHNDKIDSILWIGFPGAYGTLGIADVLCGRVSPSGGLTDIYAARNLSAPAMMNMGDFTFANAADLKRTKSSKYVMEAEGIYVGYRYYETRYNDVVYSNQGNAESKAGVYASTGNWNYAEEVTYGFGYGLSYTTFTQEIVGTPKLTQTSHGITMDFDVKVTNTGDEKGKSIVQIYGQAPYTAGGVEKAAIQLLAFDKTDELDAKGGADSSQTLKITVDMQNLASYDNTVDNGDGTKGTYVFNGGDYYFSLGNGAHDALNNVLAKKSADGDAKVLKAKMDAAGDAKLAYKWTYSVPGGGTVDKTTFAVSKNEERVSNQLDYADWNHYQGASKVTYLSRNDWSGTYPKTYGDLSIPASMMNDLNGLHYTVKTDQDTSDIKWNSTATDHKFYQMTGAEFDDYRWDELLSQISIEESMTMAGFGGPILPPMASIGFVESYLTENCGNGMVLPLNGSKDTQAPWTIPDTDKNAAWNPQVFASSPTVAASFNPKLFKELGEFVGVEALFVGLPILWGPGLNTHRHAYNGRNCEYYSEDPILSGNIAMEYAIGALDYGLIAAPKHFAFNDQETNRSGVAPFMTEQRAREVELRAFQIAFEATKYDTPEKNAGMIGLMTSFSKIGGVECTASRGLMTNILQNEWGFHGYAVTDIFDDTDMYSAVVYAGVTGYDIRGAQNFEYTDAPAKGHTSVPGRFQNQVDGTNITFDLYKNDADMQHALKHSNHNILWALCQSNLMNRYNATTRVVWQMTWWRGLYIALIVVFGVLTAAAAAMYVVSYVFGRKGEK